jgi:hypothetical protein
LLLKFLMAVQPASAKNCCAVCPAFLDRPNVSKISKVAPETAGSAPPQVAKNFCSRPLVKFFEKSNGGTFVRRLKRRCKISIPYGDLPGR